MEIISLHKAHDLGYEPAKYLKIGRQGLYPVKLDFITSGETSDTITCHFTIITNNRKIKLEALQNTRWDDFFSSSDNAINFLAEKPNSAFIIHLVETQDGLLNWTKTTRI
ncbi:hypothetical protein [Photobacterium damselae]|uniref:hypothetical protein n=1 Tax=Photobacterium damselae TaxID=38293 RepID=UPI00406870D9